MQDKAIEIKKEYIQKMNTILDLPIGEIVYYVKKRGYDWSVEWGTIYSNKTFGTVWIQKYEPVDLTTIDGVPKRDFITPTRFRKLPKGWQHNTDLIGDTYKIERPKWESVFPEVKGCSEKNKDDLQNLIDINALVPIDANDQSKLTSEITKEGWRVIREYPIPYKRAIFSVDGQNIFLTYEEAQNVIDCHEQELKRQSELSDYEWSVEQIDNVLNRAPLTDTLRAEYRKFLLSREKVEDIEVRCYCGDIQWKYWNRKRWANIEP